MTDEEFASITVIDPGYTIEVYKELLDVLDARETVSTTRDRLRFYFLAAGVDVPPSSTATTNIFVGAGI